MKTWAIVCLAVLALAAGVLLWESLAFDEKTRMLALAPSDVIKAVREFMYDWAYYLGELVARVSYNVFKLCFKRLFNGAKRLVCNIVLFAMIPIKFVDDYVQSAVFALNASGVTFGSFMGVVAIIVVVVSAFLIYWYYFKQGSNKKKASDTSNEDSGDEYTVASKPNTRQRRAAKKNSE